MPLQYASLQEAWGRGKNAFSSAEFFDGSPADIQSALLQLYQKDGASAVIRMLPPPIQHLCERPASQQSETLDKVILMLLGGFLALVILDLKTIRIGGTGA